MKGFVQVSVRQGVRRFSSLWVVGAVALVLTARAQSTSSAPDTQDETPAPKGQVLFQSHGEPPQAAPALVVEAKPAGPELTDQERSAVSFTVYDLDARITPATSQLAMRARVTLRNEGALPLTRVALQVSSTLAWESATLVADGGNVRLAMSQHLIDTDADHTGRANEGVIDLPQALGPGKSVVLDTFYSGTIAASAGRLERLGATHEQAMASDWDAISADSIALRGFGDVLWYPVASRQLFLGDGAQLFDAIGATKLGDAATTIRLRLSVLYTGDPPAAAYFCGRRQALTAISDNKDAPISSASGVAAAEFAAAPLGFRVPSLFVIEQKENLIAPLPAFARSSVANATAPATPSTSSTTSSSSSSNSSSTADVAASGASMLAVASEDDGSLGALAASATKVAPLLQEWLGAEPLSALTIVDHNGQPFEDGPLLVGPVAAMGAASAGPAMVHGLTHAWVQTGRPWMDEGLAEFMTLLWTEQEQGREAAVAQLGELMQPVSIAEPAIELGAKEEVVGQPLIAATSDLYYRRKAAAVWWMLRGIVGDEALQLALESWRQREPAPTTAEQDALSFEAILEKSGPKNARNPIDLHWFFNDWVLRDRGLPDLSIVDVAPRELPAGQGHNTGYLVAVTVRNDGAAAAEVPVTIRSATYSTTSRLRVAGFANATARVLVEALPTEVLVNDGETPEVRTSRHTLAVTVRKPQ